MTRARILADYVSSGDELALKAPLASPAFTGTVAIPNVANLETAVVANTAKVTNYNQTLADINALDITELGTVTSGVLNSGVTGGTGLTPTMDFAWWSSPASISTIYTTYNNRNRQGTSITQAADRGTIAVAGYYFADSMARVTSSMGTMEMYKNSSQTYTYSSSMGTHDHSAGQYTYSHAGFMGYLAVGDIISVKANTGYYSSSTSSGYNGAMYIWRLG